MTDETTTPLAQGSTGPAGVSTFEVGADLRVKVRNASGDVRLREGDSGQCRLVLSTKAPDAQQRLAAVEVNYDAARNKLSIDTKVTSSSRGAGRTGLGRWFDLGRHDVDVDLEVPKGTLLNVKTASGDVSSKVDLGELSVASASGDVTVGNVDGELSVNSASGDVSAKSVMGPVEVRTASGDVAIDELAGDVSIQSVSGDVHVTFIGTAVAKVNAVSGDVDVRVSSGMVLEVDANTLSGDLSSEISLDGAGENTSDVTGSVRLQVRTVSGDVKIRRR